MSKDNAQVFFRGKGAVQLNHRASQPRYAFCHGGGITAGDQLMKRLLAFIHIATGENTLAEAMFLTLGNALHSYFQGHLQPEGQTDVAEEFGAPSHPNTGENKARVRRHVLQKRGLYFFLGLFPGIGLFCR